MGIENIGTFKTEKNLTLMAINVDYNRLGEQIFDFSVNYATVPATVTILDGSIFECNGNRYIANGNETFQLDNATHNYITFIDGSPYQFGSSQIRGSYSIEKNGYYVNNRTRVFDIYIDQASETILNLFESLPFFETKFTERFDRVSAYLQSTIPGPYTGVIPFNIENFDILSNYDNTSYTFTASEPGYYLFNCVVGINSGASETCVLRKNGVAYSAFMYGRQNVDTTMMNQSILFLDKNDYIDVYITMPAAAPSAYIYGGSTVTCFSIQRIL